MSRHCQISIAAADNWDSHFALDEYCLGELKFWQQHALNLRARTFKESVLTNKTIFTDASKTACGAHIQESRRATHRAFTLAESSLHTYRGLLAIQYAIRAFEPLLTGCNVKLLTDSQMAAKIAQVDSTKLDLHQLAINIFSTCLQANIQLDLQWIPRSLSAQADYISRFKVFDDCMGSRT